MSQANEIVIEPDKDLYFTDPKKWFKGLIYFIFTTIVPLLIPNTDKQRDEIGKKLVSPATYEKWMSCFTHPSFNANQDSNYEVLEKLGDTIASTTFINLQRNRNPEITQEVISQLKAKYMSKPEQRKKADQLGLKNWVRIVQNWTFGISEDLFESLFGVVFVIGDEILGKGEGYALCNNLMINLYKDDVFDLSYKDSTSKIKEIFEKMHWSDLAKFDLKELGDPVENYNTTDYNKKWSLMIKLTPKAKKYITDVLKVSLTTDIIANYVGGNKKLVVSKAHEEALGKLEGYGITTEYANKVAEQEEEKYFDEYSRNKMLIEGFKKIFFSKNIKSNDSQLVQLIGIDEKNVKRILVTIIGNPEVPIQDLKAFAIETYKKYGAVEWYKPREYIKM